jgi:hypothetical protein
MDEKTELLIRELAEKLGTTGEHLWEVLVRQAPITATIDLLVMSGWVLFIVWAFRFISKKTARHADEDGILDEAEWTTEAAFLAWSLWGLTTVFVVLISGIVLSTTIGALINPEYWALMRILQR